MNSNLINQTSDSKISVALCTFNGAAHLAEQLQSIAAQSLLPAELVICDDQSVDNTVAIAKRFQAGSEFSVKILINSARVGVIRNFARVIAECENEYVVLCDQDDLWLSERLALSYRFMKEAEALEGKERPLLVHSDLMVGDAKGRVIAPSFKRRNRLRFVGKDPLKNLMVQNFVTGCTVLINRALVKEALPFPDEARLHDWWLALVAAARGRIISIPDATVIYRQHDQNVVGSKTYFSLQSLQRITKIAELEKDIAATIDQALALYKRLAEIPCCFVPEYMHLFLNAARQDGFKAARKALQYGIGKYPRFRNYIYLILLCKGSYRRYLKSE